MPILFVVSLLMKFSQKVTAFAVVCFCADQVAQGQTFKGNGGLNTYIGYSADSPPPGFGAGMSFYSAVWPLSENPTGSFQIGLAGTWVLPDNSDDKDTALAPPGSLARNWAERGPTWGDVFQTLEGGLGYWARSHFPSGKPKFSMNSTPQCYDYELASPGWSFFYNSEALPDNQLGVAQLSNRILIPPDALPFAGNPNGQFLGYAYMALPFTDATPAKPLTQDPPTGDQSWTCFLNSANFKGPIAFFIPETWSKIAKVYDYPYDYGRGLDTRAGVASSGAMEVNTVPCFENVDSQGTKYCKIPKLQFPVNELSQTPLIQDLMFYSKSALYDSFKAWRDGGPVCSGVFNSNGAFVATLRRTGTGYDQGGEKIVGIENVFDNEVFSGNVWGLAWKASEVSPKGIFPQYFKEVNGTRVPVSAASVPSETKLLTAEFPRKPRGGAYTSPTTGDTWVPQGRVGPFTVKLSDGSKVTYYWYRFIDQPSFKQYNWSADKKAKLQALAEKIHTSWPTDRNYMAPPTTGALATFDPGLLVQPPVGLEVGYVPIVTRQEDTGDTTPPTPNTLSFAITPQVSGVDSITMTATTASDASGSVDYYFENTTSGITSGWIGSPVWTQTGVALGYSSSYRVKARDISLNETGWSAQVTVLPISNPLSPTVAMAAAATPNLTAGTTATLSVLGADDGGEASLSYSWATVGNPPGQVSFSNNNSNSAKSSMVTFTQLGVYEFECTIRDSGGRTASSRVAVTQTTKDVIEGPAGFTLCANEGGSFILPGPCDVAFGLNGRFSYLRNITGTAVFTSTAFGGDPAPGVSKKGYYKTLAPAVIPVGPPGYTWCASEGGSYTLPGLSDVAYGGGTGFIYSLNRVGTITFSNAIFGDPAQGVSKGGFYKLVVATVNPVGPAGYTWCASEGGSYTLQGPSDVAYGGGNEFIYAFNMRDTVTFSNVAFGGDPAQGVRKSGFYKLRPLSADPVGPSGYTWCASEWASYKLGGASDLAYGGNGEFKYLYNQTGTIAFTNSTFGGDPLPGAGKDGFYKLRSVNFGGWSLMNSVNGGVDADSNKNGIPNGIEYALQLDPTSGGGATGTWRGDVISFKKSAVAATSLGISYCIEVSNDLGVTDPWVELNCVQDESKIEAVMPRTTKKLFSRLRVQFAPPSP